VTFRKDINGLRAIAIIAVVLFHFNPSWVPGGFAGVDVFFVISGFLMTGIIFKGIENNNFSISKFYVARANRIIPALAILCIFLLIFGWFYLAPFDYETLGKHTVGSIGFFSNILYWKESGYFDIASKEKWLLHTWSLSVEWQFYIIYPLILVGLKRFFTLENLKRVILITTVLAFIFSVFVTYKYPNPAYYLLPTRAWEMLLGGIAFFYPFSLKKSRSKQLEIFALILIIGSYMLISKDNLWPGYLAAFPVFGAFFLLQSQQKDSLLTGNIIFQKIGRWSYSIYLWHWPIVVTFYYFSVQGFKFVGIILSIFLGWLSYHFIESKKFKNNFNSLTDYLKCKPIYMVLLILFLGNIVFIEKGFNYLYSSTFKSLIKQAESSPYRNKCHIGIYQNPKVSCEYFGNQITWAILGDSHVVEIAYALAKKLEKDDIGLKHFSFSGCVPSYKENNNFSICSKWYNESIQYILNDNEIRNVVLNHRFGAYTFEGNTTKSEQLIKRLDKLIDVLAKNKDNIYIFYPIPDLTKKIKQLIYLADKKGENLNMIKDTDLNQYLKNNKFIIEHFNNKKYPSNVHLLKTQDIFCNNKNCYAVKDGIALYFDDDHPSIAGATQLINLIKY